MHDSNASGLPRPRLGWFSATMIIVGSMIGSGIFFAPSYMAKQVPTPGLTPGLLLGLWVLGGVLTILGALSCAELAAMCPHAGGPYVFLREAFGPLWGFLFGWTLFLVILTGFNAAVSIAFAKYLGVFLPSLGESNVLFTLPLATDWEELPLFLQRFQISTAQLVACGVIIVLTGINMCGLREGSTVQNLFTVLKVLALVVLIGAALFRGDFDRDRFLPLMPSTDVWNLSFLAGLGVAFSKALFSYDAWYTATFVAEEVHAPQRNLPRALFFGTLGVTVLYVLTNIAYLSVVPIDEMGTIPEQRIGAVAATALFGDLGFDLIILAILISTFGCVNGLILSGARVTFAMAREGMFFRSCAELHPRTGVPVMALLFQGIWSCVLTLTGSYDALLTYTTFASVLFGALTVAGVFRLRITQPQRPRPYRCWAYPVTPALYLLIAVPFLIYVVYGDPVSTLIGLALVVSGVPVYLSWRRSLAMVGSKRP